MSAYLKYPELHIEILCANGRTKVRDFHTGEVRQLPTSLSEKEEEEEEEEEADENPSLDE